MKRSTTTIAAVLSVVLCLAVYGQNRPQPRVKYRDLVEITARRQHAAVPPGGKSAIALDFKLKETWHFYAHEATAPGGMNLKIKPRGEGVQFDSAVFPPSQEYFDKSSGKTLQTYSGEFTVYVPFRIDSGAGGNVNIEFAFDGAVCSESLCQRPVFDTLALGIEINPDADMDQAAFDLGDDSAKPRAMVARAPSTTVFIALPLAILAGLVLNIMPCVWPVIPLIVMRILEQGKQSRGGSIVLGLAFSLGIMLFFVALAGANIVLRVGFDTVFDWGDHFRHPAFLMAMVLLMVVLAMFMFGLFSVGIPASVTGRASSRGPVAGSVGTGFLAAVLATPCSFAILTAAFAWAQTQTPVLSTITILLIGVGMALPYVILTSIPGLLQSLPKPGRWMEMFKQALGFVLIVIAVKLLKALPESQKMGTLYCAAAFAFSVWMWGTWVSYNTARIKKWSIRSIAVTIAVAAAFLLLPARAELIDWRMYDAAMIRQARTNGQPVLIEFTADWCLSCATVERTVYKRKDVADLIKTKGVLPVKADTTLHDYPATLDLKNIYDEPAVPITILLIPENEQPLRLRGIVIRRAITEELSKLPDARTAR